MIAPTVIGDAALAARLAAAPAAVRAALAGEADRLGRVLRDQVARSAGRMPVSIAADHGAQTTAPAVPRSHRSRQRIAAHAGPADLKAALVAMSPAIHAGLAAAFRRALPR